MKRLTILLAAFVLSACALNGHARHVAVVGDTGLYAAIAAVDDAEMTLFHAGQISKVQHDALNPKIVAMLKAGQAANRAIQVWPQGKPAPAELTAAVNQLGAVAVAVIDVLPDGPTKSQLQSKVILAQKAAAVLLMFAPLITGENHAVGPRHDHALRGSGQQPGEDWRGDDRGHPWRHVVSGH